MSATAESGAYGGTVRCSRHNPAMWWFILAAANAGSLLLLLMLIARPIGGTRAPGLIVGLVLWLVVDAVLIPIAVVQMRSQIVLDFDRGTLASGGVVHTAAEFVRAVETTRVYPGRARLLTLVFARGAVAVQVDGFAPTRHSLARNDALLAFVNRWLPMPDRYRAGLEAGPLLVTELIGRQEVASLLRSS